MGCGGVDLFATETAFNLAELCALLSGELESEVVERVRYEIRRRSVSSSSAVEREAS